MEMGRRTVPAMRVQVVEGGWEKPADEARRVTSGGFSGGASGILAAKSSKHAASTAGCREKREERLGSSEERSSSAIEPDLEGRRGLGGGGCRGGGGSWPGRWRAGAQTRVLGCSGVWWRETMLNFGSRPSSGTPRM